MTGIHPICFLWIFYIRPINTQLIEHGAEVMTSNLVEIVKNVFPLISDHNVRIKNCKTKPTKQNDVSGDLANEIPRNYQTFTGKI